MERSFPEAGLRFKTLAASEPMPLEQPKTYTYTITRNGESRKEDLVDPVELWQASQVVGRWRDKEGNVLVLAAPSCRCPSVASPYNLPHVARADYEAALAAMPAFSGSAEPAELLPWVDDFVEPASRRVEPVKRAALGSSGAAVRFADSDAHRLVYAFQVRPKRFGTAAGEATWFVAVLTVADGTPLSRVRQDFEAQFLASVAAIPKRGVAARELKLAARPAVQRSFAAPAASTLSTNAAAVAARRSIANLKDWWFAETPEYSFLSNVRSATGKRLLTELETRLPALRRAFIAVVPPDRPELDRGVVRIFDTKDAYLTYLGGEMEFSVGCWAPMRRELCILSQGKDTEAREETLGIIQHEAFHQYLFYATGGEDNAVWYNEGFACFFGAAEIAARGTVSIPVDPYRFRIVSEHPGEVAATLVNLITLNHADFYAGSAKEVTIHYVGAWALIYYLYQNEPRRLEVYRQTLREKHDAVAATVAALPGSSLPALQSNFTKYFKRLHSPRPIKLGK